MAFSRGLRLIPFIIVTAASACDGDIPVGHGSASSDATGESASASSEASESSSGDETAEGSTVGGGDGDVCIPIENEPLTRDPMVVRVTNDTAAPVVLGVPPEGECPSDHYGVETLDGSGASTKFQCDDTCDEPESAPGPCYGICAQVPLVLVNPGATFELEPWSRRMWEDIPTPAACTEAEDDICFHGLAFEDDGAPQVTLTVFGVFTTPEAYACPGGEPACVLEGTNINDEDADPLGSIQFHPSVAQIDVLVAD